MIIAGLTLSLGLLPLLFAETIIGLFIDLDDSGYSQVASLAIQFFFVAAVFQVFDGLQVAAAHALRALNDNVIPLWIAGLGYWVFGIGGGSLLAFWVGLGGIGLWWGLAMGLMVTASLLVWRFYHFMRISS